MPYLSRLLYISRQLVRAACWFVCLAHLRDYACKAHTWRLRLRLDLPFWQASHRSCVAPWVPTKQHVRFQSHHPFWRCISWCVFLRLPPWWRHEQERLHCSAVFILQPASRRPGVYEVFREESDSGHLCCFTGLSCCVT